MNNNIHGKLCHKGSQRLKAPVYGLEPDLLLVLITDAVFNGIMVFPQHPMSAAHLSVALTCAEYLQDQKADRFPFGMSSGCKLYRTCKILQNPAVQRLRIIQKLQNPAFRSSYAGFCNLSIIPPSAHTRFCNLSIIPLSAHAGFCSLRCTSFL